MKASMSRLSRWSAWIMSAVPPPSTQSCTGCPSRSSSASPCKARSSSWCQLLKQSLQRGIGFAGGLLHLAVGGSKSALRYAAKLRKPQDELWTNIRKESGDVHYPLATLAGRQGVHELLW